MKLLFPILLFIFSLLYPSSSLYDDEAPYILHDTVITDTTVEPIVEPISTFIGNISWYTASADECGGKDDGITASGTVATSGRTVACDHLPFGTRIRINGKEYIVEDCFGGNYTDRVDIFCETKEEAFKNGRQELLVEVIEITKEG